MRTGRFLFLLAALLAALPAGCCSGPTSTTGWVFQVGRPATLSTPVTVQQMTGPLAIGGVAAEPVGATMTGPVARPVIAAAPPPVNPCADYAPVPAALASQGQPCTLQEICDTLRRIESRLPAAAAAAPMPKGAP